MELDVAKLEEQLQGIYQERQVVSWFFRQPKGIQACKTRTSWLITPNVRHGRSTSVSKHLVLVEDEDEVQVWPVLDHSEEGL